MSEHLRAEFDACLKGISLRENALHRELCETRASLNEARDNFGRQHRQLLEAEQQNAALLAEVERLQRERSEWCDQADRRLTEQMTQQRDLLAENAALRARLTVDDAMVERGARGVIAAGFTVPVDDAIQRADPEEIAQIRADVRIALEAALLAAGMTEEALQ